MSRAGGGTEQSPTPIHAKKTDLARATTSGASPLLAQTHSPVTPTTPTATAFAYPYQHKPKPRPCCHPKPPVCVCIYPYSPCNPSGPMYLAKKQKTHVRLLRRGRRGRWTDSKLPCCLGSATRRSWGDTHMNIGKMRTAADRSKRMGRSTLPSKDGMSAARGTMHRDFSVSREDG